MPFPSGAFYPTPEQPQRLPNLPIPKQGDSPPRIPPLQRVQAETIRATPALDWPAQTGPRLLPRTYGQQPPRLDPLPKVQAQTILAPQLDWLAQKGRGSIPPTYGDQPSPLAPPKEVARTIRDAPSLDWNAQRGAQIVPLALVYGQQPPRRGVTATVWSALDC